MPPKKKVSSAGFSDGENSARAKKRALEKRFSSQPPKGNDGALVPRKKSYDFNSSSQSMDFSTDLSSHDSAHESTTPNRRRAGTNDSLNISGHGRPGVARNKSGMSASAHSRTAMSASGHSRTGVARNRGEMGASGHGRTPVSRTKSDSLAAMSASRPGVARNKSMPKTKTKVKLRDTDRLIRKSNVGGGGVPPRGRQLTRQGSSQKMVSGVPPPNRGIGRSKSSDGASLVGGSSAGSSSVGSKQRRPPARSKSSDAASTLGGKSLARQHSQKGLERTNSVRSASVGPRGRSVDPSEGRGRRSASQDPAQRRARSTSRDSRPPLVRTVSGRSGIQRVPSNRPGIQRVPSARPGLERDPSAKWEPEQAIIMTKQKSHRVLTATGSKFEYSKGPKRFRIKIEKRPPKSLVIVWLIVSAELVLDLITTIISFIALFQEDDCCGLPIEVGTIPMSTTAPFFVLIVAEVCFLVRAMKLTMCPPPTEVLVRQQTEDDRWCITRWCCGCLRWNARLLFKVINWLVLLNPFFGAVVAWILLYQSSKTECFVVLGLEGASLFLHFLSVYLEGERQTTCSILVHLVPVLPFLVSVILILVYLQQGGVCYQVERSRFWYDGCRLCDDGFPPEPGNMCRVNVTYWNNYTNEEGEYVTIPTYQTKLVKLADNPLFVDYNGEFCGNEEDDPKWNATNFCFFTYD